MAKTYVVIGGSSGIGYSLVQMLSAENNVVALSRTSKSLENNASIKYYPLDVIDRPLTWPDLGIDQLDGLVYLPGSIRLKPFGRISREEFLEDLELNVMGAILSIQHFLPMLKKSRGSIVLLSTVAVNTGMSFHTSVAVSKGALEGLARSLAAELAPLIRVNVVAPSLVNTPLAERFLSTEDKIIASSKRHPLQKVGEPEDIANMISFLLDSSKSGWVTGQTFHVDGGMSSIKNA